MGIKCVLVVVSGKVRAMNLSDTMPSGRKVSTAKNLQRFGEVVGRSVSIIRTPVDLLVIGVVAACEKTGIDDLTIGAQYGYTEAERMKAIRFGIWKATRTQDVEALRATVKEKGLANEGEDVSILTARQCAERIALAAHASPYIDEQSLTDMKTVEDAQRLAAIKREKEQAKDAEYAPITGNPDTTSAPT